MGDRKSPDLIDFSSDIMDVFATSTTQVKSKKLVKRKDTKTEGEATNSNQEKPQQEKERVVVNESLILYRATLPFPASSQYELELKMGDVIIMNKIREDGWCKGTLQRSG